MKSKSSPSSWNCLTFSTVRKPDEVKELRKWLRDNCSGAYKIVPIRETLETAKRRTITIATLVRLENDGDAVMMKMVWHDRI